MQDLDHEVSSPRDFYRFTLNKYFVHHSLKEFSGVNKFSYSLADSFIDLFTNGLMF